MAGYHSYRQLRIFVSSTFRDMQEERKLLVGKVFPVIAEYCHRKNAEFTGVDLRWGVTDEQSQRGETVDICMSEIDKCRPLFIGMLGERYGWVPDGSGISVTEQEILYGALEAPEDTEGFFYLRDPGLTRKLEGEFEPDARQEDLKERIRCSRYPVMDGYTDLESLEARLISDLTDMVDRIVSKDENISAAEDRRRQHRFMAQRYAAGCVRRDELTDKLDELASAGGLVLVTGESGMGKTSLVSDWALRTERESGKDGQFMFLYFAGSTDDKGWEQMCRQLTEEIRGAFGIDYPDAVTPEELRRAVHILLSMAAAKKRVTLVIDQPEALDTGGAQGLSWLPGELPEGVTVILCADESKTLKMLRKRSHSELAVERLSRREISDIAVSYLASYSKSIGRAHLAMLEECEDARNPLYLITVLNEVRHTGRHEELTEQLSYYLSSRGIQELFSRVLSRIDQEYDAGGAMLPRRMLSMMEACRNGITEAELISILGDVPQARLAPLRLSLEAFTAESSGAIHVCVPEFRQAVKNYYGIDEDCLENCRNELADWFTQHRDTPRRSYVLPWILSKCGRTEELASVVSETECLSDILGRDRYELKEYWAELSHAGYSPGEAYSDLISSETHDAELMTSLAEFLAGAGEADAAKKILDRITGLSGGETCGDEHVKSKALGILGNIYLKEGQSALAFRTYSAKLTSARRTGDRHEQLRALGNIGIISMMQGSVPAARQAFNNVLSIGRRLNNKEAEQIALGNLGNIAFSAGDLDEAYELYRRQLEVSTESGNTAGMINAYGAQGVLHLKRGDLREAKTAFGMQQQLSRRIGAMDSLANALGNMAAALDAEGDKERAEELLNEKLDICRREKMPAGEQNALGNLAELAAGRGDLDQALDYARERMEITVKCRMIRQYAQSLMQLAAIEENISPEDADTHRKKAEIIARQHGFKL